MTEARGNYARQRALGVGRQAESYETVSQLRCSSRCGRDSTPPSGASKVVPLIAPDAKHGHGIEGPLEQTGSPRERKNCGRTIGCGRGQLHVKRGWQPSSQGLCDGVRDEGHKCRCDIDEESSSALTSKGDIGVQSCRSNLMSLVLRINKVHSRKSTGSAGQDSSRSVPNKRVVFDNAAIQADGFYA